MAREMVRTLWQTEDGHRYTSIPTDIPEKWERRTDDDGTIVYSSGEYEIERYRSFFVKAWEFRLTRQTVALGVCDFSRLSDAKAHAVKNARGEDVVNVA